MLTGPGYATAAAHILEAVSSEMVADVRAGREQNAEAIKAASALAQAHAAMAILGLFVQDCFDSSTMEPELAQEWLKTGLIIVPKDDDETEHRSVEDVVEDL